MPWRQNTNKMKQSTRQPIVRTCRLASFQAGLPRQGPEAWNFVVTINFLLFCCLSGTFLPTMGNNKIVWYQNHLEFMCYLFPWYISKNQPSRSLLWTMAAVTKLKHLLFCFVFFWGNPVSLWNQPDREERVMQIEVEGHGPHNYQSQRQLNQLE